MNAGFDDLITISSNALLIWIKCLAIFFTNEKVLSHRDENVKSLLWQSGIWAVQPGTIEATKTKLNSNNVISKN